MMATACYVSAEQSIDAENMQENEENQFGDNLIENYRTFIRICNGLTAEEKKDFLSDAGLTEESFKSLKAFAALDWMFDGSHSLPNSNSSISIPDGYALVTGSDADAIFKNDGEPAVESLEGYVCNFSNFENAVLFQYFNTGYISTDDAEELDSKTLLDSIIENTQKSNRERRKNGNSEIQVIGWVQEPTFDKESNTVYWAIESESGENENTINAVALRLGREGYEQITWITSKSSYTHLSGDLDVMLRAHNFDVGYRYNDYTVGDKVAEFGIAALVAASIGGKIMKIGSFVVFLKKIAGVIFACVAALSYKFKNLFRWNRDGY
jgi:uncharacterized membrane-anchored protein